VSMPRGDRTGPMGFGPMTGRGMGFCGGFGSPGFMNPGYNRGFEFGYGRGWRAGYGRGAGYRGWGRGYGRGLGFPYYGPRGYDAPAEGLSDQALDEEVGFLKNQLAAIEDRLAEIEELRKSAKDDDSDDRRSR
jgi:hypothetical protein